VVGSISDVKYSWARKRNNNEFQQKEGGRGRKED
jgi:hypothetical protein